MYYRRLGHSGPEVSVIGFGTWEMGGNYGWCDQQEACQAVQHALDLGVTLFDTAPTYGHGRAEALLGRALGARRHEAIIVTKCGLPTRPHLKPYRDGRYQTIMEDVEESLRALQTDYVDLLLLHWPDPETPLDESMRALMDLQQAGKARFIGVSNFAAPLLRAAREVAPICANQVGYNLFDRRWERHMFGTARELGIGVMAYGPLAHGLLSGTLAGDTGFEPGDWRRDGLVFGQALFTPPNLRRNLEVVDELKLVAQELGTTLPCLALAWVLREPVVAVALCGVRRPEEIEENVRAPDVWLEPDTLARIDAIMMGAAGLVEELPA